MGEPAIDVRERFNDQIWRLSNLYKIVDADGKLVRFEPNWMQLQLLEELSLRHLILKARKLGASTFINILQVDCAVFRPNFWTATIAHDKESMEKMFDRNICTAYDNLPEHIRAEVHTTKRTTTRLHLANGSDISVTLSTRSGTPNLLHISEFGKICARRPDKAQEIVTGAIESVPQDGVIAVESTAEGHYGYFYDWCMDSHGADQAGHERSKLDWRLSFFPWWKEPQNRLSPRGIVIRDKLREYFERLEGELGFKLDLEQKAWYAAKWKVQGSLMKQEHPSTVEEAFEQTLEGAYYAQEMARARTDGRICSVQPESHVKVDTWWDLGVDDKTAIWFVQRVGNEYHLIDFYQASGEGLPHYVRILHEKAEEHRILYGDHIAPHDIDVREWGGDATSRLTMAENLGVYFTVCPRHDPADGIEAVRAVLDRCWFDKDRCHDGIKALEAYRREWDEVRATWRQKPLHDWASDPADAFRTGVMGGGQSHRPTAQAVKRPSARNWA